MKRLFHGCIGAIQFAKHQNQHYSFGCVPSFAKRFFCAAAQLCMVGEGGQMSKKLGSLKPEQAPESKSRKMSSLHEMLASLEQGLLPPSVENFISTVQICRDEKNLDFANRLLDCIRRNGMDCNVPLVTHLVLLLVEVGSICQAQEVFDGLDPRSESVWNTLIVRHINGRDFELAFSLFQLMQRNSAHIDAHTFVALLKACTKLKDLRRGQAVHDEIFRHGLDAERFVGSALICMYATCGLLTKAQAVFDKIPVRDVILWNTLIAGYAQHGHGEEALKCFHQMQLEGFGADNVTCLLTLKACGGLGATFKGQEIHCGISVQEHLERDLKVGNALVDMYAKCGLLGKAQNALSRLPFQDAVSWNAMISGFIKQEFPQEALNWYEQMQSEGVFPDAVTLACCLKACGDVGASDKGRKIHAALAFTGILGRDVVAANALVDMYAKCGMLSKAEEVFNLIPCKDAVSWTALMTGYVHHGNGEEALRRFEQMQMHGIAPDSVTLLCSLQACIISGSVDMGCQIHAEVARRELMHRDLIGNTLIDMYAKFGLVGKAQEIFDNFPNRDVVSWNALIGGYAEHGYGDEALGCFAWMQQEGIFPDAVTFVCALNACGDLGDIHEGLEIHAEIARKGLLESDLVLGNAIIDMYANCGAFEKAWEMFEKLSMRQNVSSWNAIIAGYVQHQLFQEALDCYKQMLLKGIIVPDISTYVSVLKACGSTRATYMSSEVHVEVSRKGLLENSVVLGNVLIDSYFACGSLAKAQEVFDSLPSRDVISWTVLIAGHTKHGLNEEALELFEEMQLEGFSPNLVTYLCILAACGSLGALHTGLAAHAEVSRRGLAEGQLITGNVVMGMYANCGLLANAEEIFGKLPMQSIVSWSSLVAAYAQAGKTEQAFLIFERMEMEGENPNLVTFVSILNACSHAGLVAEGQFYFRNMSNLYELTPRFEHHSCLLDLLSRAGRLKEAMAVIMSMPFHPTMVVWHTMLGACKKWDNIELGREAFGHAMQLDEKDIAAFVCMSNIYTDMEEADYIDSL